MAAQDQMDEKKDGKKESSQSNSGFYTLSKETIKLHDELTNLQSKSKEELVKWLTDKKMVFSSEVDSPKAWKLARFDGLYEYGDSGGFIHIQTTEHHAPLVIGGTKSNALWYTIGIYISDNGKTVHSLTYGDAGIIFDENNDNVLSINNGVISAQLTLGRHMDSDDNLYGNIYYTLTKMNGTVSITGSDGGVSTSYQVSGTNGFNAVGLSKFCGLYSAPAITADTLNISSIWEFTLFDGTSTQTYNSFVYVPSMFVLKVPTADPDFNVMLGTSGGKGKAAFLLREIGSAMLYTIP